MPGCSVCRVAMTSVEENIRSSSFVRTQVRSPQKLWVRFTPNIHASNRGPVRQPICPIRPAYAVGESG